MAFSFKWQGINFLLSLRHKFMLAHLCGIKRLTYDMGLQTPNKWPTQLLLFFLAQNVITKSPNLSLG